MDDPSQDGGGRRNRAPRPRDDDIFRALSLPGPVDAEALVDIRARILRSLDDPRPSLSMVQVDDVIGALVAGACGIAGAFEHRRLAPAKVAQPLD